MAIQPSFPWLQQQPRRDADRALAVEQQQSGSQEFQPREPGHWLSTPARRQQGGQDKPCAGGREGPKQQG